jgi:hypothetical protein
MGIILVHPVEALVELERELHESDIKVVERESCTTMVQIVSVLAVHRNADDLQYAGAIIDKWFAEYNLKSDASVIDVLREIRTIIDTTVAAIQRFYP